MSAFFDTNVLVYLVDSGDPSKRAIATELVASHLRDRSLVISTQVLQELYATLLGRRFLEPEDAAEMIATLAQERVIPSTGEFVVRAVVLARRYELSLWDALVVRAAIEAQCGVLFTEDLQDGMRFGELRVVNPFLLRAHDPDTSTRRRAGAGRAARRRRARLRGASPLRPPRLPEATRSSPRRSRARPGSPRCARPAWARGAGCRPA